MTIKQASPRRTTRRRETQAPKPAKRVESVSKVQSGAPLLFSLHHAVQAVEGVFDRESQPNGPTACQYAVLQCVAERANLSQKEICDRTGIDRSTLAEVARRLVSQGFLLRVRSRNDGRRYEVRLTAQGEANLQKGHEATRRTEARFATTLSTAERKVLLTLLSRIALASKPVTNTAIDRRAQE